MANVRTFKGTTEWHFMLNKLLSRMSVVVGVKEVKEEVLVKATNVCVVHVVVALSLEFGVIK